MLLIEDEFLLEKFQGKGGWTYFHLSKDNLPIGSRFGLVKVSGSIDAYCFDDKHLMPMGNSLLFLPISKPIRKEIGKEEGEFVYVKLYQKDIPDQIPAELIDCLKDDPGKYESFMQLSSSEQNDWVRLIYLSDNLDQQASKILKLLRELEKH